MKKTILTTGSFDDLNSRHLLFLYALSKRGPVHVVLFDDALVQMITGKKLKFPLQERRYILESVRYVDHLHVIQTFSQLEAVREITEQPVDAWYPLPEEHPYDCRSCAEKQNITCSRLPDDTLSAFPEAGPVQPSSSRKVVVTGCFDWFHSGHVRFLEEASTYGDLYAIVGHDANIRALKGNDHPMFGQDERRFMVGSLRSVRQALISSGNGWLDAEPEIEKIQPDIYLVNSDGNKDLKRAFCKEHGIEYVVLQRTPKPGLKARTSTNLRGF